MIFFRLKNFVLELFFPKSCLGCGREGSYVCDDCFKNINYLNNQVCPACRKVNYSGIFCSDPCRKNFYFDQLFVCVEYKHRGLFQKLMIRFKYKFSSDLNDLLGKILVNCFCKFKKKVPYRAKIVVPVPIHKKKLKKRGFNQSRLLAEVLTKNFDELNLCDCLNRKEYHADQAKLDKKSRLENLTGAIDIKNNHGLKGKVVILIDDVATTGSTLNECGKVLKANGAKYVCGLVLARARLYSL